MTRPIPQDRRRRGAVAEPARFPVGAELADRLAALAWHLPPLDPKRLRRRGKGKR